MSPKSSTSPPPTVRVLPAPRFPNQPFTYILILLHILLIPFSLLPSPTGTPFRYALLFSLVTQLCQALYGMLLLKRAIRAGAEASNFVMWTWGAQIVVFGFPALWMLMQMLAVPP